MFFIDYQKKLTDNVHLKCSINWKIEKMLYKTRSNLGNKSWKVFCCNRMPGPNKSRRHAVSVSLGTFIFHYPKSPQILVVSSSNSFSLMFMFLISLLPLCSRSSSLLDQSWGSNLSGMYKSWGRRRKEWWWNGGSLKPLLGSGTCHYLSISLTKACHMTNSHIGVGMAL